MALPFELLLVLATFWPPVAAIGEICVLAGNRLDPSTAEFLSACAYDEYCVSDAASSQYLTCQNRLCRKDEWPAQYPTNATWPPRCPSNSFCPDEGSGCLPLLHVGSACQLNRDDQCEPAQPLIARNGPSRYAGPRNTNGAICLSNVCTWANVSIGSVQSCAVDNAAYFGYSSGGAQFVNVVSRDNCAPGGWCDATALTCRALSTKGQPCVANKACDTYNCLTAGVCGPSLSTVPETSAAGPVVTALFVPMILALWTVFLARADRRHRLKRRRLNQDTTVASLGPDERPAVPKRDSSTVHKPLLRDESEIDMVPLGALAGQHH